MRLIDADALKTKIEQSGGEGTIARYCKRVLAECLDNDAPTIDAISVEWLKEQAKDNCDYSGTLIRGLLSEWQKEQEGQT